MKQSEFPRFDFAKPPLTMRFFLQPIAWGFSYFFFKLQKVKVQRVNMADLKPPYLLLVNHNSFNDFLITTIATFPQRSNNVVAIDGFIGREWLMRWAGCLCKRKFTSDIVLVRQLRRILLGGHTVVLYPEARYSLCGTTAVLPESLGKMVKIFRVPLVTLIIHGDHILKPFWDPRDRGIRNLEAEMTQILSVEEINKLSVDEINRIIREAFVYDEFAWQKAKGIRVSDPNRAHNLHKVLYQCPHCGKEYQMTSKGTKIWCEACQKSWTMSELGELQADQGETEFSHIPDWYEWERLQVRKEVENGTYFFSAQAHVNSLPNAKRFIPLGQATFTHNMNGFRLEGVYQGEPYRIEQPVNTTYSVHIEYEYLGKFGDCVDLNTSEDTFYVYPENCRFSLTKIALATEELYQANEHRLETEKAKASS
ncbi:MAG: hypothetical protein LLG09_05835 [Negativicutes bacterium]|nr:hypothetical protein [Negativicutes bacterium]